MAQRQEISETNRVYWFKTPTVDIAVGVISKVVLEEVDPDILVVVKDVVDNCNVVEDEEKVQGIF